MLENKDYCDYELRLGLRDIGYPVSTCQINDDPIQIPKITLYEAQKWLREEKNIEVNASFDKKDDGWIAFIQRLDYPDLYGTDILSTVYNTYESALVEGIKETIKILKDGIGE